MRFNYILVSILYTISLVASAPVGGGLQTGQGTFFHPGLGACGGQNTDSDLITAIGVGLFTSKPDEGNPNNNPFCGKQIQVSHGGKTVQVTVVDECQSCGASDLDMSPAAFQQLAAESKGRIPITWKFIS